MLGFCSSVEFSFIFSLSLSLFNFLNLLLVFLHLFLYLLFLLLFSPCLILNTYKSYSFTSTELCISILSFFPFLSTYLLVLFSLLYSPIGTLLQFCCPVCTLVSLVLADIIFGFLCLPDQPIVLYFCWTVLTLLMYVYVYVYIPLF